MEQAQQLQSVTSKMLLVMEEIGAIAKSSVNQHQKYKFRGIDAVYAALQPALIEHGLVIIPRVAESSLERIGDKQTRATCTVEYTLVDTATGASVVGVAPGEALDTSDKAMNKAWTAAFKYFIFQTFCIPTEDAPDADADHIQMPTRITSAQVGEIKALVDSSSNDKDVVKSVSLAVRDAFKQQLGVSKASDIPAGSLGEALAIVREVISDQV